MQKEIDFDRCELARMTSDRGIFGIAAELIWLAATTAKLVNQDALLRLPLRISERAAAQLLKVSKSGLHDALLRLEQRGLVTRGRGLMVVEWSAFLEMPELDPLHDMPAPKGAKQPAESVWSVDGRSMVGPLEVLQEQESNSTIHPTHTKNQEPRTQSQETDHQPTAGARRLPFQLKWRHLFLDGGRPHREGIIRLWATCVEIGWRSADDPLSDFGQLLGLVLWLDTRDRREAGIEHPLSWLIAAVRDGPAKLMSWPPDEYFERARGMCSRADGLLEQLESACGVSYERSVSCVPTDACIANN